MAKGGRREGAGRKKGSQSKRTQAMRERERAAIAAGKLPLEIMLEAMREAYAKHGVGAAVVHAKEAAPYCHPRLSAVAAKLGAAANPFDEIMKFVDDTARKLPKDFPDPDPGPESGGDGGSVSSPSGGSGKGPI